MGSDGVLVMAYGTPLGLDDVERYYTHIRQGLSPSPEALEELTQRYRAIGGRSPLLEITAAQARGVEERVPETGCYVGYKHAPPFIEDAVEDMARDRVERAVGLVLAPHYSNMSVGAYDRRVRAAARGAPWSARYRTIPSWHLEPGYVSFLSEKVAEAIGRISGKSRVLTTVVFTAHSLPAAIVDQGDPYPSQLEETAAAVASRARLGRWRTAWQSAGRTSDTWLGPDILDVLRELAGAGERGAVICPCGFVADHLEVLYDVDVECRNLARDLGFEFARTASPNDDPRFLDALAAVVARALGRA